MAWAETVPSNPTPTLSICIATFNRGSFIGATLDSVLAQIEPGVELVVVDGASSDSTAEVMRRYCARYPEIRYRREDSNSGVDADYDKAVGYATGDYCWLMTDDDLLKPGAVRRVVAATTGRPELIVVNAEVRNINLSEVLETRRLEFLYDQSYTHESKGRLLREVGAYLSFIGCVVIRREVWQKRDRRSYYGSLFIHVGVIFQKPSINSVRIVSEPLIEIRYGNAMWTGRSFEIWMFKWPHLIWSFPEFSDADKRAVCRKKPWSSAKALFHHRAIGSYSPSEFQKFWPATDRRSKSLMAWLISHFPARIANFIMVLYFAMRSETSGMALYDLLHCQHANSASIKLAKALGIKLVDLQA